jgi:aryl-alcohol dehydrogenase-like predicted oxidoreductase
MADLPKRELGRTGLQVTMLGYGAMELLQSNLDALRRGPLPPALYAEAKRRLADAGFTPQAA